jgi:hypothetical protein
MAVFGMDVHAAVDQSAQQLTGIQQQKLGQLRLPFVPNQGQTAPAVAYYARTFAGTAFVTQDGALVLNLPGIGMSTTLNRVSGSRIDGTQRTRGWSLVEVPVSQARLAPNGHDASAARVSIFKGLSSLRDQPTFFSVRVGQPWPGIDYELRAHGDTVERVFTVAPAADADAIRMQVKGALGLTLRDGALIADTGNGPVTLSKPVAYQEINGQRKAVSVAYVVEGDRYGFCLGGYDTRYPVVIDPLVQATYLGGSATEYAYAVAVGSAGQVYVAGATNSTGDFPGTTGGAQASSGGDYDAFVAVLNSDLTSLTRATYLGGSGEDGINSIALDSSDNVYVAGFSKSSDFNGVSGGAQASYGGGGSDAFVAELGADLTTLTQATYLGGGAGAETAFALALGASGQVYVTGYTYSADFPGTTGGAQAVYSGVGDVFVAELNAGLTTLTQATFLGAASALEQGSALAVGSGGQVYVGGFTESSGFPGTSGGTQAVTGGGTRDAFVAELSGDLTTLIQSTYLGGSGDDLGFALALGGSGQVYVAGQTTSNDLPGVTGGAQAIFGGVQDAFVAVLSADLTTLTRSAYLGGTGIDDGYALAIGSSGQVYVAGDTAGGFPGTAYGTQATMGGGSLDAFVAELSSDLTSLTRATYLGGSGNEGASALAVGSNGHLYVAAYTSSSDVPNTSGGAQASAGGGTDALVADYNGLSQGVGVTGGGGGGGIDAWTLLILMGLILPPVVISARTRR